MVFIGAGGDRSTGKRQTYDELGPARNGVDLHRAMMLCEHYANAAVAAQNLSEVRRLVIDEISRVKGHDYVSLFAAATPPSNFCRRR